VNAENSWFSSSLSGETQKLLSKIQNILRSLKFLDWAFKEAMLKVPLGLFRGM